MASKIGRTAGRKRLLDVSLSLSFVAAASFILWKHPASLEVKFGYFSLAAVCLWLAWRRHQLTRAAQAIATDDPRVFFEKAIENVRAEINLSTASIYFAAPAGIVTILLGKLALGLTAAELLRKLYNKAPIKIFVGTVVLLAAIYFIRDNIRLRRQLRRLESMSREWAARDPGEEP
ncbi:MAG TPA: hypothetical protein VGW40_14890 [Allosphingosinicella sp.]|nr:hypothetical protein [Allosphingosinicella sp.]